MVWEPGQKYSGEIIDETGYKEKLSNLIRREPRQDIEERGITYESKAPMVIPGRKELVKTFRSAEDKARWEESHCTRCQGAYKVLDREYSYTSYDRTGHRCMDFCPACKKAPEWVKEIDYYDHVCGLDDDTLWLNYGAKISGYKTWEEYRDAKIGTERSWSVPHILWAVFTVLVTSAALVAFLAGGGPVFLAIGALNAPMLLPAAKGITDTQTFYAKIMEITDGK